MNYLIWKGKDSRDIKGLVICELPPISKPQMRVSETVVNGVDGSVIEELGYESYNKSIAVGITQKANIDEVIKYFSGTGEVVFSNEPDKYYKATIIAQTDYERLVRFRTATVTFRVQPFKYEYLEESLISGEKKTTGAEVKLSDANVMQIQIDGKSTQNGTPTPQKPVNIVSVADSKTIKVSHNSKNIFNINETYISDCVTVSINGNAIYIVSDDTGLARVQFPLEYKLNTPYILSFDATISEGLDIGILPNVRLRKDRVTFAVIELTATTEKKHYELKIPPITEEGFQLWLYLKSEATISGRMTVKFENIQIEEGEVVTEYAPYGKGSYNISLPEPLRSLSNGIKDSVILENNKVTVYRNIGSIILNGSEYWSVSDVTVDGVTYKQFFTEKKSINRSGLARCFKESIGTSDYASGNVFYFNVNGGLLVFVNPKVSSGTITTVEQWKSWLSSNNTEVFYALEYPEGTITADRTGKYIMPEGSMTITNSENTEMTVNYIENRVFVINKGNHTAKPVITIKGTGYIEFILNDNKLFSYMFPNGENTVVIDCEKQDAYLGADLKNRNMSGEFPVFEIGENIITWAGNIESIEISSKSRWL